MPDPKGNPHVDRTRESKESKSPDDKTQERHDLAQHVEGKVRSQALSKGKLAGLKEGVSENERDVPVNPFQQGPSAAPQVNPLPPREYEDRYDAKDDRVKAETDEKHEDLRNVDRPAGDDQSVSQPINPFDITTSTPVRPIEDRPLVEKEDEGPEEHGESEEIQQVGTEDAAKVEDAVVSSEVREVETDEKGEKAADEFPSEQPEEFTEVLDVTPDAVGELLPESQPEEFKEELWDILAHAGITKKRILYFLIFLVLAVIGIVFLFSRGGDGHERGGDNDAVKVVEDEVEDTVADEIVVLNDDVSGLETAYIIGLEHQPLQVQPIVTWGSSSGYEAGFIFGLSSDLKEHAFVDRVALIRKLDNMYRTDVYNLVNLATDRRAALTKHLRELDELIKHGRAILELIDAELADLSVNYTKVTERRDASEILFFDQLNALLGDSAYDNLQLFVDDGQLALKLKADFKAREMMSDKLLLYLEALEPRYVDISVNFEALLKGVRVFDIEGSDIDAIVPVR